MAQSNHHDLVPLVQELIDQGASHHQEIIFMYQVIAINLGFIFAGIFWLCVRSAMAQRDVY